MKPKHTPGPWKVELYGDQYEVWNQNTFVCSTDSKLFRTAHSQFEDKPNAKLIAAAPTMFEALKALEEQFETEEADGHNRSAVLMVIQNALKKVEGK